MKTDRTIMPAMSPPGAARPQGRLPSCTPASVPICRCLALNVTTLGVSRSDSLFRRRSTPVPGDANIDSVSGHDPLPTTPTRSAPCTWAPHNIHIRSHLLYVQARRRMCCCQCRSLRQTWLPQLTAPRSHASAKYTPHTQDGRDSTSCATGILEMGGLPMWVGQSVCGMISMCAVRFGRFGAAAGHGPLHGTEPAPAVAGCDHGWLRRRRVGNGLPTPPPCALPCFGIDVHRRARLAFRDDVKVHDDQMGVRFRDEAKVFHDETGMKLGGHQSA